MAHLLNIIYVVAAVVLLFGAAVFVHEFGHYWVARRCGMKVEAFAIGFGPKILGWTRDGIEYSWRWIPAGGFVKLPQMVTSEALEGSTSANVPPAPPWSKIKVAFAGPFMNVAFAFVIAGVIYLVGLPELVNPPIIGYVAPDSAEAKMGIHEGDRVISVNGEPVKSWQDVQGTTMLARTNVLPVVIERGGQQKTYQLTAAINKQFDVRLKLLNLDPRDHPVIKYVEKNGPAAKAGLKLNDEVASFAGVPILNQQQLVKLIQKHPNETMDICVRREGQIMTLQVTPVCDDKSTHGRIGVGLEPSSKMVYMVRRPGPTPWEQVSEVWRKTIDTFGALFHSRQTGVGISDLSGPPGILAMLAAQINTDYRLALSFLVLLNINLAVLNLLPVPVLDGGHIMIALIERLMRRPMNVRLLEYTTTAFAVLLISFMLYVSFNDVKRFPLFKSMFQHETQIESGDRKPDTTAVSPAPAK
jgi:regulator of sigma E protease